MQDTLKTSSKRLEDVWPRRIFGLDQEVLKTPSRRLLKTYDLVKYIRLGQDVFSNTNVCCEGMIPNQLAKKLDEIKLQVLLVSQAKTKITKEITKPQMYNV